MLRLVGIFVGGIIFAILAAMAVRSAHAQADATVSIPVDCGQAVCVIPKAVFQAVLESHNAAIDEIRKLKAELAGRGRTCPGDKGA